MDPKQTLLDALAFARADALGDMAQTLSGYWNWRHRQHGFEPIMRTALGRTQGDEFARCLTEFARRRVTSWPALLTEPQV